MCDKTKDALRREMKTRAAEVTEKQKNAAESDVMAAVEALPRFAAAQTLALYAALPDEIPTRGMIDRWSRSKRVVLPVVDGGRMSFREYSGRLATGAFGIAEPDGREVEPAEIDLMIVPGAAFDRAGRRLGRGGGFYDRYLSSPRAAAIYKIGVCLPCRLVGEVPAEAHDTPMDIVITAGKAAKK